MRLAIFTVVCCAVIVSFGGCKALGDRAWIPEPLESWEESLGDKYTRTVTTGSPARAQQDYVPVGEGVYVRVTSGAAPRSTSIHPSTPEQARLLAFRLEYDAESNPARRKRIRNQIIQELMAIAKTYHERHDDAFYHGKAGLDLVLDAGQLAASMFGTVAGSESAKAIASAIAGGLKGAQASIDYRFLQDVAESAILAKGKELRMQYEYLIEVGMRQSDDEYDLDIALMDITDFLLSGGIADAVQAMAASAMEDQTQLNVSLLNSKAAARGGEEIFGQETSLSPHVPIPSLSLRAEPRMSEGLVRVAIQAVAGAARPPGMVLLRFPRPLDDLATALPTQLLPADDIDGFIGDYSPIVSHFDKTAKENHTYCYYGVPYSGNHFYKYDQTALAIVTTAHLSACVTTTIQDSTRIATVEITPSDSDESPDEHSYDGAIIVRVAADEPKPARPTKLPEENDDRSRTWRVENQESTVTFNDVEEGDSFYVVPFKSIVGETVFGIESKAKIVDTSQANDSTSNPSQQGQAPAPGDASTNADTDSVDEPVEPETEDATGTEDQPAGES